MLNKDYRNDCDQEQAGANNARREAFEAAVKGNRELYLQLSNAAHEAASAHKDAFHKYRALSDILSSALALEGELKEYAQEEGGIKEELAIASNLFESLNRHVGELFQNSSEAYVTYASAREEYETHFPDPGMHFDTYPIL